MTVGKAARAPETPPKLFSSSSCLGCIATSTVLLSCQSLLPRDIAVISKIGASAHNDDDPLPSVPAPKPKWLVGELLSGPPLSCSCSPLNESRFCVGGMEGAFVLAVVAYTHAQIPGLDSVPIHSFDRSPILTSWTRQSPSWPLSLMTTRTTVLPFQCDDDQFPLSFTRAPHSN